MPLHATTSLVYIADPMCSWCWGFSPVMESLQLQYQSAVHIELLVGGLRPGNTERFDEHRREYILGHWKAVHERTGQPFNFEFRMSPNFTYDTKPSSRGVVVARSIRSNLDFPVFREIQRAFYVENRDVTKETVLTDVVTTLGIAKKAFLESFHDPKIKQQVWREFERCRELGITRFASLLGKQGEAYTSLAHGYMPFDQLIPLIENWLKKSQALTQ